MKMSHRYAVIGSGRQGTAATYDLACFGDAEHVLLADQSLSQGERASARVNQEEAIIDLFDYYDESTGFTAMERTTGWHAAIMAGFIARGQIPQGGVPVELAVPGTLFVEELRKRGFDLRVF